MPVQLPPRRTSAPAPTVHPAFVFWLKKVVLVGSALAMTMGTSTGTSMGLPSASTSMATPWVTPSVRPETRAADGAGGLDPADGETAGRVDQRVRRRRGAEACRAASPNQSSLCSILALTGASNPTLRSPDCRSRRRNRMSWSVPGWRESGCRPRCPRPKGRTAN